MRTIGELLHDFRTKGVKLWAEGEKLRFEAPKGALTPAMKAELKARKTELLAFFHKAGRAAGPKLPTFTPVPRNRPMPLSASQRRLWFLDQMEGPGPVYNIPIALRLRGRLDLNALRQSFEDIVRRHESLRTAFPAHQGTPVQQVVETAELPFEVTACPNADEATIRSWMDEEAKRPFDLTRAPLLRVRLWARADDDHFMQATLHHIIADGWSVGLIVAETASCYRAFQADAPSPHEPLAIQYADFAAWQTRGLDQGLFDGQRAFWLKHLRHAPAMIELPTDHPRPPVQTYRGDTLRFTLDAAEQKAVETLGRAQRATLFMTLLSIWQVLLARYSGQTDIVVGSPIANRNHKEIEPLIGFFVNTLALRTDLSGDPSFRDLLDRVRQHTGAGFANEDLPFDVLVDELAPERGLSHAPIFQTVFILQNALPDSLDLPGVTMTRLSNRMGIARFDLTLEFEQQDHGLLGILEYNTDLFDPATAERLAGHYRNLLHTVCTAPDTRLSQLSLMDASERQRILVNWNATHHPLADQALTHLQVERWAAQQPHATAVVVDGQIYDYAQLNADANRIAHGLRTWGIGPDQVVAVSMNRSYQVITVFLGILKAGAGYLPLDPEAPADRTAFMLTDADARLLIHGDDLQAPVDVPALRPDDALFQDTSPANPHVLNTPDHLAYMIYTSGSTGTPKGVMIPHRGLVNQLLWRHLTFDMGPGDRVLQSIPLTFDPSVWQIFWPLTRGAAVAPVTGDRHKDPVAMVTLLRDEGITAAAMVPSMLEVMLRREELAQCTQLKHISCGGEALSVELQTRFIQLTGRDDVLQVVYGPTEASIDAASRTCRPGGRADLVHIGRPITNTRIYILNNHLQPQPVGVHGDLYIAGPGLARGYRNRPAATAEVFVPNPFAVGAQDSRLYRSGDRAAWLPNGEINFLGRADHQVKVRGFRIELGEIESALSADPVVDRAVVTTWDDPSGNKSLAAYLTLAADAPADPRAELRARLAEAVPAYMVPPVSILLDAMPLLPGGKVNRAALPAPDPERDMVRGPKIAARNPTESDLVRIWAEVLEIQADIGVNENFFELGGHSLLATRVVSRIRETFGVELPVRELFLAPTPAELAQVIARAPRCTAADFGPLEPQPRRNDAGEPITFPLSFAQQRLWFLDRLEDAGAATYNLPLFLRLSGRLNHDAMNAAFSRILERHEVLRTHFPVAKDRPHQAVRPFEPIQIPMLDFQNKTTEDLQHFAAEQTAQPFNLAQGPLLRVFLLNLGQEEHALLVVIHHIVTDGWSMGILAEELTAAYHNADAGRMVRPLPQLPVQYIDFSHWQRLHGDDLQPQRNYWRRKLAGAPPVHALPMDHARPSRPTFRGARTGFALSTELSAALETLARNHGGTLFSVLEAAFATLIHRYSGADDVVIGTAVANRTRPEVEPLIGFFANTLALRNDLSGDPTFAQFLTRVTDTTLEAQANQDVPFEQVVDALQLERDLSITPVFQLMFVLQNAPLDKLELPDLVMTHLETQQTTAMFDTTLSMIELDGALHGVWEYSTELFTAQTVDRMISHFQNLLTAVATDASQPLSQLPLLSQAEQADLTDADDQHALKPLPPADLWTLLRHHADTAPTRPAMIAADETVLTYGDLAAKVDALASQLSALCQPGDTVALHCQNGPARLLGLSALLKAGLACLPMDPTAPRSAALAHPAWSHARLILTQTQLEQNFTNLELPILNLDQIEAATAAFQVSGANPAAFHLIDGNVLDRETLLNNLTRLQTLFPLTTQDRVLHSRSPLDPLVYHELLQPLLVGAAVVLDARDATVICGNPQNEISNDHPIRLRLSLGGPLTQDAAHRLTQPPAELTAHVICLPEHGPLSTQILAQTGPQPGPTQPDRTVTVRDAHGRPQPVGVAGRLHLHQLQGQTVQDIALALRGRRTADGRVMVDGFMDRRLMQNGLIIDPVVIENHLHRHPNVLDCVVTQRSGQALAFAVSNGPLNGERVRQGLAETLPAPLVPSHVITLTRIPRTADGAVDHAALNALPVRDEALCQNFEDQLKQRPGIMDVAALVHQRTESGARLHLNDLIPNRRAIPEPDLTIDADAQINVKAPARRPAFADGGPMVVLPDTPATMTQALVRTAQRFPNKGMTIIDADHHATRLSYADLLKEARAIRAGLAQAGFGPGDRAILQITGSRTWFPVFWGCVLAGVTPVTVAVAPTFEENNAVVAKLFHTWSVLDQPPIIATDDLLDALPAVKRFHPMTDLRVLSASRLAAHAPNQPDHEAKPQDHLFYQLTSGSTGNSKCIPETHHAVIRHILGTVMANQYTHKDVALNWLTMDHVVPVLTWHLRDIFLGCERVEVAPSVILGDPLRWLDLMAQHRVTNTWAPNFGFKLINDALLEQPDRTWNLDALRLMMNAGEQVTAPVIRETMRRLTAFGVPMTAMQPAFGMAEIATCVTYFNQFSPEHCAWRFDKRSLSGRLVETRAEDGIEFVNNGPPIPGVQIRITDTNNQPVEEGVIGRIQFRGEVVNPGYLNNPAANAESFVGDGWFNSGDLGFLLDGQLAITGREKEMIVIHGVNFYCYDIEEMTANLDGVIPTFVAAVGFADPQTATEGLAVFFVGEQAAPTDNLDVVKAIRTRLTADLGVSPAYVIPVHRDEFYKTTSGKIQRGKFKQRLLENGYNDTIMALDLLLTNNHTLPDWFFRKIWRPDQTHTPAAFSGAVLLLSQDTAVFHAVKAKLEQQGAQVITAVVGPEFSGTTAAGFTLNPADAHQVNQCFTTLNNDHVTPGRVIHMTDLDEPSPLAELSQPLDEDFFGTLHLIQALNQYNPNQTPVTLLVVAGQAQAVSTDEPIAVARNAVFGFLESAGAEFPWLSCRHLDLTPGDPQTMAAHIVEEAGARSPYTRIARRNGRRLVQELERLRPNHFKNRPAPFKARGFYVITGGLGDLGQTMARHLLQNHQADLLLLGRTALESDCPRTRALRALKQLPGRVTYVACDITRPETLAQTLAHARDRYKAEVDGVLHLAGVLAEQPLTQVDRAAALDAVAAKVTGSILLEQHIPADALMVDFSSVNAWFGGYRASLYAAANAMVDALSQRRRAKGRERAWSIAWSMWEDQGMSRAFPDHVRTAARERGFAAIADSQGTASLDAVLHQAECNVMVGLDAAKANVRRFLDDVDFDLNHITIFYKAAAGAVLTGPPHRDQDGIDLDVDTHRLDQMPLLPSGAVDRDQLTALLHNRRTAAGERTAPRNETERRLAAWWSELLGGPRPGIHDNFFEMGGHSLLATQLLSRIQTEFGVNLSVARLFQAPTIAELAAAIDGQEIPPMEEAPITHQPHDGRVPMSFAQRRMWLLDRLAPGASGYNIPAALRFDGQLNVPALTAAVNTVIQRHEAARTIFTQEGDQLLQIIAPQWTLTIPETDLSLETDPHAAALQLAEQEAVTPFDLEAGPLLRAAVLHLGRNRAVVLFTMHHIISDGWSMNVLIREVAAAYAAALAGEAPVLPPLPIQYADYARRQAHLNLNDQLEYWTQRLSDAPKLLQLPTDRRRPTVKGHAGATLAFQIDADLTRRLNAFSQASGATLFMTLRAAFALLLARYGNTTDLCIGSPTANRNRVEVEPLIGFFVNTLVLREDLAGNPDFRELVARAKDTTLTAFQNQDVPFEAVVEHVSPERDPGVTPLFQVLFSLQDDTRRLLDLPGLKVSPLEVANPTAKFDLSLIMSQVEGGLHAWFEYSTDLFNAERIAAMADHFNTLLGRLLDQPDRPVFNLPLIDEAAYRVLSADWNQTSADFPRADTVAAHFARIVNQHGADIALVETHGEGRQFTYAQLDQRANQLAQLLCRKGVTGGSLVGVCLERGADTIITLVAVLKAGGAYVCLDAKDPAERLAFMIQDINPAVIVTRTRFAKDLPQHDAPLVDLDQDQALIQAQSPLAPRNLVGPDAPAYLIFTSGSTGKPKAVIIPQRGILRLALAPDYIGKLKTVFQLGPVNFDASTFEIWAPLLNGGRCVIYGDRMPQTPEIAAVIRNHGIKTMVMTTALFNLVIDEDPLALRGVTFLLVGGEALSPHHVRTYLSQVPNGAVTNGYGPTESTTFTSHETVTHLAPNAVSVPLGLPIANTTAHVLDRAGRPVPVGVPGELCIGGDGLASGYHNRPALTAAAFTPNPFEGDGARLYRSGDLVCRLPNGSLDFLGRIDHQVKIRGFRIELPEIEAVIGAEPIVASVAVVVVDQDGDKRLAAYVVPEPSVDTNVVEALKAALPTKLPHYMVPADFVLMERLPLTSNGKVNRAALPKPEVRTQTRLAAPKTQTETQLVRIWGDILGKDSVSTHDDFFQLGGHSLTAVRVVARLREELGVDPPLTDLFTHTRLIDLARSLDELQPRAAAMVIPLQERNGDPMPLSFAQNRLWFIDRMERDRGGPTASYNIPAAFLIEGQLDIHALETALSRLIARHETLRTLFTMHRGAPAQQIQEPLPVTLNQTTIDTDIQNHIDAEAARPFDLEVGPLIRFGLASVAKGGSLFTITMHHIISDGWSVGVLMREIIALYKAARTGVAADLPELPVQYADFAVWQRRHLTGEHLTTRLDYWRNRLKGAPNLIDLPTDYPRATFPDPRGDVVTLQIPRHLVDRMEQLGREAGASTFMLLQAAFAAFLYRYGAGDDIVIGNPHANRDMRALEPMIGFFVNMVPGRVDLNGTPDFLTLLDRMRRETPRDYQHADLPFEHLVDHLDLDRDPSYNPVFQVALAFDNNERDVFNMEGLSLTPLVPVEKTAKFDLIAVLAPNADGIGGGFQYAAALFKRQTVERMVDHFLRLLTALIADPARTVLDIPLMEEAERRSVLGAWGEPRRDDHDHDTIISRFLAQVEAAPQAAAVTEPASHDPETGDRPRREITFAKLNQNADRIANRLDQLGVRPGDFVGLHGERSLELIAAVFGILKTGAAYVPLDSRYPAERRAHILNDCDAAVLISDADGPPEGFQGAFLSLNHLAQLDDRAFSPQAPLSKDQTAYMIYTSGSTGKPKGVIIPHHNVIRLLTQTQDWLQITADDVWPMFHSYAFDVSVHEIFGALLHGARLVLVPYWTSRSPREFHKLIREEAVTVLNQTPSAFGQLLEVEADAPPITSLRQVIFAGEALQPAMLKPWFDRYGDQRTAMINMYGITETTVHVTYRRITAADQGGSPIGGPIPDLELYVLDRHLQPVPYGVPGELYVGGPGLARGYHRRPGLTAERYIPNPFSGREGDRLYRSGDLARLTADGNLLYLGRIDRQIKVRGHRIEMGEIEACLNHSPAVARAHVMVREDQPGDQRLVGYFIPDAHQAFTMARFTEMEADLPQWLAPHDMPNGMTVLHRNKTEVDFLYQEVFQEETYLKHGIVLNAEDVVFDVGANIGVSALYLAHRVPGLRIFAFEPLPPIFETLSRNTRLYDIDVTLFNCGLSSRSEEITFTYYPNNSIVSGRYADEDEERETVKQFLLAQHQGETVSEDKLNELLADRLRHEDYPCVLRTLSEIVREHNVDRIDLLKVDVEKSELDVLMGIEARDWDKIQQVVIEVHDTENRLEIISGMLEQHGFQLSIHKDEALAQTRLYNIYGTRAKRKLKREPRTELPKSWASTATWRERINAQLARDLPDYMAPSALIPLPAFPLTTNGKIDVDRLPAPTRKLDTEHVPPRNEMEAKMAKAWQEVLGVEVGVHDDFFAMGGHSMLAVRLMDRIEHAFGKGLPLSALFQSPTVATLTEVLRRDLPATGAWTPIVAINPEGELPPFFAIHPGGGNVLVYQSLAGLLGPNQPFFGLEARGLAEGQRPQESFAAMAQLYLEHIRRVQPDGPYYLGGLSSGGVIAYEIAQQLKAVGEEVAFLAMLDTYVPSPDTAGRMDEAERLALFAAHMARGVGVDFKIDPESLRPLPAEQRIETLAAMARAGGVLPEGGGVDQFRRLWEVSRAIQHGDDTYVPKPIEGRITLFRAEQRIEGNRQEQEQAWGALASQGCRVYHVPGSHHTIIEEPHVQILAACMADALTEARERAQQHNCTELTEGESQ